MKTILLLILFVIISSNTFAQDSTSHGKISGYMFSEFYYNAQRDTISNLPYRVYDGEEGLNGFQFKRIYFTYDYDISKKFTTRFRLEGTHTKQLQNSSVAVFIKDAYITWLNVFKGSSITVGIQPVLAYTATDKIWKRYVERTIMDYNNVIDSRDFGISLNGNLDEKGKASYGVMLGNNSGIDLTDNDKYKRIYGHLAFNPISNVYMTLFSDFRSQSGGRHEYTEALMVAYKKDNDVCFGVETFWDRRKNFVDGPNIIDNHDRYGISVFSWKSFNDFVSIYGRFDYFNTNLITSNGSNSRNLYIAGLEFRPDQNVYISPNVAVETYQAFSNGKTIKPSVTPRISVFYSFF